VSRDRQQRVARFRLAGLPRRSAVDRSTALAVVHSALVGTRLMGMFRGEVDSTG